MTARNKNTPALRFKTFQGSWSVKRLGELGSFKNGLNKNSSEFGFGSPFVNLMDVFGKSILEESNFGLVNATASDIEAYDLKEGDVLFIRSSVKRSGVGETILIAKDLPNTVYSGFLIRFRNFNNTLGLEFKNYCFSNTRFRNELLSFATSSANTNINQESLAQIKVHFPSLPEQQKIASFLSAIDKKILQLTRKKELLKQYKKGVMQQLFSGQLRFKDENGKAYPKWEEKKIGEITNVSTGGTPNTNKSEYWGGKIRWMNSGELNLKIVKEVENRITEAGLKNSSTKIIPVKCILIGLAGQGKTRGTAAMNLVELCTNQSIASILPNNSKFIPEYLYQNIDQRYNELRGMSTGDGGRGGLNLQIIKSFIVPLPNVKEQQKIANFLSGIDTKIEIVDIQIEQIQIFKKGLLQQLFI